MADEKDESSTYRTRDLYFAAYLMACGHDLVKVSRKEGAGSAGLSDFLFDGAEECEVLHLKWTNSNAQVEASLYAEKLIKLKKLCHRNTQ